MSNTVLFEPKTKRLWIIFTAFFAISMALVLMGTLAHGETFIGKAVNHQGVLEYVEHHTVKYENGKVSESQTIYYDSEKKRIGDLISDYSHGAQFGSYDFRDIRAQYQDGAKVALDRIWLFRKQGPEDDLEEKHLPKEADQIVGQGFHHTSLEFANERSMVTPCISVLKLTTGCSGRSRPILMSHII